MGWERCHLNARRAKPPRRTPVVEQIEPTPGFWDKYLE
jgi:hypothetical protein